MHAHARLFVLSLCGCTPSEPTSANSETTTATAPSTSKGDDPSTTASATSATSNASASTSATTTSAADTSQGAVTSTGAPACEKRVVLMGYWPPTNEMLRPWSTNPAQNPGGWIGADWGGHGYDVHAFFPEFPPDGDPTNDAIGSDGSVGSPEFDLRVDYQATSADFWRIVDEHEPVILLTTSRGGDIGWEIEAFEGGHGDDNSGDPALDWVSDAHGDVLFPTEASIEPRSWTAISTHRQRASLATMLPVQAIVDATSKLGITDVVVDSNTSGTYLSGFLGLHGLHYELHAPTAVAAGHIHVGRNLPVADASTLLEATLHAILVAHPADAVACR